MARILIRGATGSLGRHVLHQALAAGHEVSVFVRTPSRLPSDVHGRDWRLLRPGPMVDEAAIGLDRLRISVDTMPVRVPAFARALLGPLFLPVFASLIPQMIVPYADAAAVMLANLDHGHAWSRRRIGLALPVGMRGRKSEWSASPLRQPVNAIDGLSASPPACPPAAEA